VPSLATGPADNRAAGKKPTINRKNTLTKRRCGSGSDGHGRLGKEEGEKLSNRIGREYSIDKLIDFKSDREGVFN
jgi:hypothetical protein